MSRVSEQLKDYLELASLGMGGHVLAEGASSAVKGTEYTPWGDPLVDSVYTVGSASALLYYGLLRPYLHAREDTDSNIPGLD